MHYIESAELVRVAVPSDAAARALLVRRLDTLATLDHPHLVPLIAISPNGPDNLDVRLSRTGAVDLPTAVGSRGPLTPAEASGVTVAVAQALAALHGVGLVHGGVRPTDVLLRSDGSAVLRPRVTLPEHSDDPVDVTSLATLIESVLGFPGPSVHGKADEALRSVLARARADDPRDRPEPGTLAALVHDAVPPEPVRLPHGSSLVSAAISGPVPVAGHVPLGAQTPSAWRSAARTLTGSFAAVDGRAWAAKARRRARMPLSGRSGAAVVTGRPEPRTTPVTLVATGMIAAGVVAGITAGVMALPQVFGSDGTAVAAAEPSPAAATPRWGGGISPIANAKDPAGAAIELTERRLALLAGAVSDPKTINVEGSPAYQADAKTLEELRNAGAQVVGASAEVLRTELVTVGPGAANALQDVEPASLTRTSEGDATSAAQGGSKEPVQAVVRIEYTISAHVQVSRDSETAVPASQETAELVLVWTPGGWRVSEVR